MNIADYFKGKAETPIHALIDELQKRDVPITLAKRHEYKSDTEALVDRILKPSKDVTLPA